MNVIRALSLVVIPTTVPVKFNKGFLESRALAFVGQVIQIPMQVSNIFAGANYDSPAGSKASPTAYLDFLVEVVDLSVYLFLRLKVPKKYCDVTAMPEEFIVLL